MSTVRLEHLTKIFPGAAPAVADFNLEIGDGEFIVLVGPSGCGKSTVLRMIAGLEDVTGGDVVINERRVTDEEPKDRDIAMVFQNYALYPNMTVRQNLGFALRLRHVDKAQAAKQVSDMADVLMLSSFLDRKPAALSGGQRQRVAMGRAMVRRPQVFLMDEPLSNLDARLRVSMRAELTRLHQRYRVTTVYVTHDQVEAMTLGDRIAVLDLGRLQQVGTPEELYQSPANRFVAGFMGSPSMNFATVELSAREPVTVVLGEQHFEVPQALHRWPGLAAYLGRCVVIGLRPAALSLDVPTTGTPVLPVVPLGVESLGDEKHLLFEAPSGGGHLPGQDKDLPTGDPLEVGADDSPAIPLWTAKVGQRADVAIGRPVRLAADFGQAYFFDPDTGETIAAKAAEAEAASVGAAAGS